MPRLVIKHGPGIGRDHALGGAECVVGRDPTAHFTLDDAVASRRHVRFVSEAGLWYAEDLGSTNGTLVNGKRAQRVRLHDGDVIRVGNTHLSFVQKDLLGSSTARRARAVETPPPPPPPAPKRASAPVRRRRRR